MTALTLLRYFLSDSLITHIMPILRKLTKHSTAIISRKSYLVLFNIHQTNREHLPDIKGLAVEALGSSEPPVKFAGLSMIYPLIMGNPHQNKELTKRLAEILKDILDHKYPKEYDYHRIPAPWFQVQILKMI